MFNFFYISDVESVGAVHFAMNAWSIQAVNMVHAMAQHGIVSAIPIGVVYYAIKV